MQNQLLSNYDKIIQITCYNIYVPNDLQEAIP